MSERKKAARFRVRIHYEATAGDMATAFSTYMTKSAADKARLEWIQNGHPEATIVEDVPEGEKKVGRMSGT